MKKIFAVQGCVAFEYYIDYKSIFSLLLYNINDNKDFLNECMLIIDSGPLNYF
jgi:hypothetical protein